MYELWRAGESAYGAGQHRVAAEHYRQATAIAESCEDAPAWFKGIMRRSLADELTTLERLREALAVLSNIPKTAQDGYRECCVYGSMTDQIEIAQRLPASLQIIERAYAQAEAYFRSAGDSTWRGQLLYYRADLLYERGLYAEALAAAQEGASFVREDCPKVYPSSHSYRLFRISLALRDLESAVRYLRRWVEQYDREDKRNPVRGAYEYLMRSQLARAEGLPEDAAEWSRRGAESVASGDWGDARFALGCEQVRAFILAGRHGQARALLSRLAPSRRSEGAHRRYGYALLRGDFHLARARAAAGLPQLDDEFGTTGAQTVEPAPARPAALEARKAGTAYATAMKLGVWIDEKLECSVRTREINGRGARLSRIAGATSVIR
jgi:tetratricopeptide (TPR) repeat protein